MRDVWGEATNALKLRSLLKQRLPHLLAKQPWCQAEVASECGCQVPVASTKSKVYIPLVSGAVEMKAPGRSHDQLAPVWKSTANVAADKVGIQTELMLVQRQEHQERRVFHASLRPWCALR